MVRIVKTKIMQCNCKHEYQDQQYGLNKRVHNPCPGKSANEIVYRCTVCSKQITQNKETK